jgi:hypothetical protein
MIEKCWLRTNTESVRITFRAGELLQLLRLQIWVWLALAGVAVALLVGRVYGSSRETMLLYAANVDPGVRYA